MDLRALAQEKLDEVLLPHGVLSHHLRRVKTDEIKDADIEVNKDEYVVFRIVSSRGDGYGDGNAQLVRYYLDVNYYYAYEKTDSRFIGANERIEAIMSAFLADHRFHIANGQSDIYDLDNPYRGINIEFLFVGVNDR